MRHSALLIPDEPVFRADPHRIGADFNALPFLHAPPNTGFQARTPAQPTVTPPPAPAAVVVEPSEPTAAPAAPQPVLPRRPAADPDALAAARAEGHAAGLREGHARAEADLEDARAALAAQASALTRALCLLESPPQSEVLRLTQTLTHAIHDLAAERAGQAIDANAAPFAARIAQMVSRVMQDAAAMVVHLHPDDLAALQPILARAPDGPLAQTHLVADATLRRGDADLRAPGVRIADCLHSQDIQ